MLKQSESGFPYKPHDFYENISVVPFVALLNRHLHWLLCYELSQMICTYLDPIQLKATLNFYVADFIKQIILVFDTLSLIVKSILYCAKYEI